MPNPLVHKLRQGVDLTEADRADLDRLVARLSTFGSREFIAAESEPRGGVHVLLSGWACRFKSVPGASRQILGFLLPGDHTAFHRDLPQAADYGLCALTRCEVVEIDQAEFEALLAARPNVDRAFRWASMIDEAILREWLANLGCRPAERRMAHLVCELLARLQMVGLAAADAFALPLTQATLGDALGLSPAHVNRSLQSLRARRLLSFEDGWVRIDDVPKLRKFAGFNAAYLGFLPPEKGSHHTETHNGASARDALNA